MLKVKLSLVQQEDSDCNSDALIDSSDQFECISATLIEIHSSGGTLYLQANDPPHYIPSNTSPPETCNIVHFSDEEITQKLLAKNKFVQNQGVHFVK